MKIKKNLIIAQAASYGGSGHVRQLFPAYYINSKLGSKQELYNITTVQPIIQPELLAVCKTIIFQRWWTPQQLEMLKAYKELQKRFKFKMVWDIDDLLWGKDEGNIPEYNNYYDIDDPNMDERTVKIMNMMDLCTFSTEYLRDYAKKKLKVKTKCIVVPNTVPKYLWGMDERKPIEEDIVKPKILYPGCSSHYSNIKRLLGDWDNAWREWVIESVKNDEIEFVCMGGLPWFFEEIKDKIEVINWIDTLSYPALYRTIKPDFVIAPLVESNYNRAKSDIKYIEAASQGIPFIGTRFDGSPYKKVKGVWTFNAADHIGALIKYYCRKDRYNAAMMDQYCDLKTNNRYTESSGYIQLLLDKVY